ncbi:MAG TPA: glycosyltransferase [Bacteroidia bacterium]|nr:glycosyltransferase [Bacteroidia bacterium]
MLIELYIFAFIIVSYGILITLAIIGFNKLKLNTISSNNLSSDFVSIVISARNEEDSIESCIYEIAKQNYPKSNFELIIIDDCSNDKTYILAEDTLKKSGLNYQVIKQDIHQGKKQSVARGIEIAKGNVIITSDADIINRHSNWLKSISGYFANNPINMLIMPIDYCNQKGIISKFQIVENIALTGVTAGYTGIGKPFMCNGANLAFKKNIYEKVNGYESHLHLSSGEDIFLLESFKTVDANKIFYGLSRELIVKTKTENSLGTFLNQRTRWASKTKNNSNFINSFFAFTVVLSNLIFLALLVAILKKSIILPYLSIFGLAKFVFDFLLLFLASDFLGRLKYIWLIIPFECVYWIYALIIGLASFIYRPSWKGKKIN